MKHILTLCVGNICRSPLAEALLRRDLPTHIITSAGLNAMVGSPADPLSVRVAIQHELDISAHRAQQVSSFLCQRSDLILVMNRAQKSQIEDLFPVVRGKVFRLGQFSDLEVDDPYRQPYEEFVSAYAAIALGVADWVPRILKLS